MSDIIHHNVMKFPSFSKESAPQRIQETAKRNHLYMNAYYVQAYLEQILKAQHVSMRHLFEGPSNASLDLEDMVRLFKWKNEDGLECKSNILTKLSIGEQEDFVVLMNFLSYLHESDIRFANLLWARSRGATKEDIFSSFMEPKSKANFDTNKSQTTDNIIKFLNHPYWDKNAGDLDLALLNLIDKDEFPAVRLLLQQRIEGIKNPTSTLVATSKGVNDIYIDDMSVERISDVVAECQSKGTLKPLRDIMDAIEKNGDTLVGSVLDDVNKAFSRINTTFWEVRELINSAMPGSYANPIKKEEAPQPGIRGFLTKLGLFKTVAEATTPTTADRYKTTVAETRQNVDDINQAVDALYALHQRGAAQSGKLHKFSDTLREYLAKQENVDLETRDPIVYKVLNSSATRFENGGKSIQFVQSFTLGLAERIIPVGDALAATLGGATVLMTLQTAKTVLKNESWVGNFQGALEKMADASTYITGELQLNSAVLRDVGDSEASELAKNASLIHETLKSYADELKTSQNPATPIELVADQR